MNILHTSDFHLGKKLYKKSRDEEHQLFLDWLEQTITKREVNLLIIAGDVFDSPIPPTKALKAYFDFLNSISTIDHLQKIIVIAGNHDSGHFLEAPLSFLSRQKIHIAGQIYKDENISKCFIDFPLQNKTLRVANLPFFRAHDFIKSEDSLSDNTPEEILTRNLKTWLTELKGDHTGPSILVGHHLFGSFFASGSEQTVSLSGLDSLPLDLFTEWDLLTLGHIHKKQILKKKSPLAVYCGSPIAMRFSESHHKSVYHYEVNDDGIQDYEEIQVPCKRLLKRVNVTIHDYQAVALELSKEQKEMTLPSFVELSIRLLPEENIVIDNIIESFKNLDIEVLNLIVSYNDEDSEEDSTKLEDLFKLGPQEIFEQYLDSCDVSSSAQVELMDTFNKVLLYEEERPEVLQ